jgi:hypothetical protein
MVQPQIEDEDVLQLWRVTANILNKQLLKVSKGWSSRLGVGLKPLTARNKIVIKLTFSMHLRLGKIL